MHRRMNRKSRAHREGFSGVKSLWDMARVTSKETRSLSNMVVRLNWHIRNLNDDHLCIILSTFRSFSELFSVKTSLVWLKLSVFYQERNCSFFLNSFNCRNVTDSKYFVKLPDSFLCWHQKLTAKIEKHKVQKQKTAVLRMRGWARALKITFRKLRPCFITSELTQFEWQLLL